MGDMPPYTRDVFRSVQSRLTPIPTINNQPVYRLDDLLFYVPPTQQTSGGTYLQ